MRLRVAVDRFSFIALIGVVLAGLVFLLGSTGHGHYVLDDAYIVDHSVMGILSGHESRFIGSTPWQGVTSPAYVAPVVLLSFVMPVELAHWAVSALSVLLLACGWYVLCRRASLSGAMSSMVVLTSLMAGMTFYQLANGLETGMAMAALTWTLIALQDDRPPMWGYALMGMSCFIRPELAALSAVGALYIFVKRPVGRLQGFVVSGAVFVICALLLMAAAGTLAPNTMSAKTYFFAEGCLPAPYRAAYVLGALWAFVSGLGLFAIGFLMAAASPLRMVVGGFAALFLSAYFLRFPGALFHNQSRYLYLLLPIAVLGWTAWLSHADQKLRIRSMVLGVVAAMWALFSASSALKFYDGEIQTFSKDNAAMAEWVTQHVPKDAVILVHDAGRISLQGQQPLVDLVGLKSPYSAEVHRRLTYGQCQRVPAAIADIAKHAGASYMVVTSDWDKLFKLTGSLASVGWTVERADAERGNSHYRVYRILESSRESKGKADAISGASGF